jgi:predicted negative regulator of RcsB-dependent stress response
LARWQRRLLQIIEKGTIVDDLLSEKEQIDRMRVWWSEYGGYVIGGIVLGALILFSIDYYRNDRLDAQLEASSLYDVLALHVDDGNLDAAEIAADDLATSYTTTSYAAQSKLAMARLYMDKNRDQDAADVLHELLALSGNEELKHIGRVRLAKILLYQNRAEEVIALLEDQSNAAFAARYAEALGDAYIASNRYDDAQEAYRRALAEASGIPTVDQTLVQLKLLDLPKLIGTAEIMPAAEESDTALIGTAEISPAAEESDRALIGTAEIMPAAEESDTAQIEAAEIMPAAEESGAAGTEADDAAASATESPAGDAE